jgi:diguanylate cyclase (GGDEF)-like protein
MRLHAKLILVLIPLIALPLAVLGWVAYSQQRDSVEKDTVRQLGTLVHEAERHFQARLEAARADVLLFASSRALHRYMLVEDEAVRFRLLQPALLKLFASYQLANPEYYEIRVLLPDGYEDTRAVSSQIPNVTDEEAETGYFSAMSQAEANLLTQIVINPDNGEPAMIISHRIALVDPSVDPVLAKPKLRGYLVVTLDLSFLEPQAHDANTGSAGHLFFTTDGGHVLFQSDPTDHVHHHVMPENISADIIKSNKDGTLDQAVILGERFFMRGRSLHDDLNVLAMFPAHVLLESTRRIARLALALIIGSILLTATLLFSVLRSLLLAPLARLGQAAREVGAGNPVTDVGIDRNDELGQLASSFEEMSKNLQHSHDQIAHLAHHDSLTGLPNRRLFTEILERALVSARSGGETLALLFMDLDDFKRVNDSLGHQMGDDLLREVGERLSGVVRPDDCVALRSSRDTFDTVARLGGDEFILLLHGLRRGLDAATVARRLLDELARPIVLDGTELKVNASIGITLFPDDASDAEGLIKNADIAMYHAKEQSKNHYQFFTRELNTELVRRIEMEAALRRALEREELLLYYQPQVEVNTGEIEGIEALIRWRHPELGMVPPNEFIPLAEETGLILPIGHWVLQEACRQSKAWQDAGAKAVPVAVNVSARQFSGTELQGSIKEALESSGLAPEHLDVELTETSVMKEPESAIATLIALKQMGIRISMDDFGTGYSSLGILKRLPIDCLKIDKSFIDEVVGSGDDAAITVAIIAMAKSLGLHVIAEGVEQVSQLAFLRAQGCDMIQGYLISRPVPAEEMGSLLAAPATPLPSFEPNIPCGPDIPRRKLEVVR